MYNFCPKCVDGNAYVESVEYADFMLNDQNRLCNFVLIALSRNKVTLSADPIGRHL